MVLAEMILLGHLGKRYHSSGNFSHPGKSFPQNHFIPVPVNFQQRPVCHDTPLLNDSTNHFGDLATHSIDESPGPV